MIDSVRKFYAFNRDEHMFKNDIFLMCRYLYGGGGEVCYAYKGFMQLSGMFLSGFHCIYLFIPLTPYALT